MKKGVFYILAVALFFNVNPLKAEISPCENPYAPSYTVCENNHCTTYCNTPIPASMTTIPRKTYQYSVYSPYGSLNVSNEYVGVNIIANPLIYHHNMPPRYTIRPAVHYYQKPLLPAQPARPTKRVESGRLVKSTKLQK